MNETNLSELFLRLAAIEALSQHEMPVADQIQALLAGMGLRSFRDHSQEKTGSDTGNLICQVGDGGDTLFLAHMDTARPPGALRPRILADRITSDGTTVLGADNRAGIALLVHAVESVLAEGRRGRNFTLAFTVCEETSLAGSLHLEIEPRSRRCFIFDSSLRPGAFITASCGAKSFRAAVKGVAAHSGLAPERGINAIAVAARALCRIRQGRVDGDATVNIGLIQGGSAVNVVPEAAILKGEVRAFDMGLAEPLLEEIRVAFAAEAAGAGAGLDFSAEWDFKPYRVAPDSGIYRDVLAVLQRLGLEPSPVLSLAGSDANSLNGRGIQAINLGIGAQNPHADDEFILLEDLNRACAIAMELMKRS